MTQQRNRKLRTAIIPAAGFGTRLFPATKVVKKELFPIVGPDGIARPAILHIVEEALSAGIEEVILVVRLDDEPMFRSFFAEPITPTHAAKLPPELRGYADRIVEIGQRVRFAIQSTQKGFGHAVFCARELVGANPFLLLLGDHLYRSATSQTCAQQLAQSYDQYGRSIVGLTIVPGSEIVNRGVIAGEWLDGGSLLQVRRLAEKPSVHQARQELRVSNLPQGSYLALFGQYILDPSIFEFLAAHIRDNRHQLGEVQLTSALEALREQSGCLGLLIQGHTFDIGQPRFYVEALQAFHAGSAPPSDAARG